MTLWAWRMVGLSTATVPRTGEGEGETLSIVPIDGEGMSATSDTNPLPNWSPLTMTVIVEG